MSKSSIKLFLYNCFFLLAFYCSMLFKMNMYGSEISNDLFCNKIENQINELTKNMTPEQKMKFLKNLEKIKNMTPEEREDYIKEKEKAKKEAQERAAEKKKRLEEYLKNLEK